MSDYIRSTREIIIQRLQPELLRAIREYIQEQELGDIESEILICCETKSELKKKRLLGGDPDPLHYTGILVTPSMLIWGRYGTKTGTVVTSALLRDIRVNDFDSKLLKDTGIEVYGFVGQSNRRVRGFIGLGSEAVTQKFKDILYEAANATKDTSKRKGFLGIRFRKDS